MAINTSLAGKEYDSATFEVTAEGIERYALATNDPNERYVGGDDVVASPVYPFVIAWEALAKPALDPELNADLMRLVHGEEEHVLYKPVRPGDRITVAPVLESAEQKESGETFTIKCTETNQDEDVVAEIRVTNFIRGSGGGKKSSAPAEQPQRDVVYEETTKVDEDQTQRYAEASGDHNPIHLDEDMAKMVGLPRTINHGMCTMAIATKGAVNGLAGGDPTRIRRVKVRFSKPVFPGQELTTRFWKEREAEGRTTYGFETYNPEGAAVIKNAEVEIAEA